MKKRLCSLMLVVLILILSAAVIPVSATEKTPEQYLASMSTEDKISMMRRQKNDRDGNHGRHHGDASKAQLFGRYPVLAEH